MASSINADNGVVSGSSGLKSTADTSGVLALQSNGTTGLTLNTSLALGVGSGNSTGSAGQVLTSAGSGAAPSWTTISGSSQWVTSGSNIYYDTGNVGIGGAPSNWSVAYANVLQTKGGSLFGDPAGSEGNFGVNLYYNAGYKYAANGYASVYQQYNAQHIFKTAVSGTAGNAISFTNSLVFGKGTTLALEGATSQTGTGITFPATQSASSDANTLDDYEEGSWTPAFTPASGSFTGINYFAQEGRYVKVGRSVMAWGFIYTNTVTVGTASGALSISGLPFSVATGTYADRSAGPISNCNGWVSGNNPESVGNIGGGTIVYLWKRTTAGGGQSQSQVSDMTTGTQGNAATFVFVYEV